MFLRAARKPALSTVLVFVLAAVHAQDGPPKPLGLPPIAWPQNNPYSSDKAALGLLLFFDKRLSVDGSVACASCHVPQHAFAEPSAVSTGIRGQKGKRNALSLLNQAWNSALFWDGRASTLEDQIKEPIQNPVEMGNAVDACVHMLQSIEGYRQRFEKAFGSDEITIDLVGKALATFERTLVSGNSPATRNAQCTPSPYVTIVTSVPSRTTAALPIGRV